MTDVVLQIKDLHVGYEGIDVVHGVDLSVHANEIVALLGRNGAGKSTTVKAISGLLRPSAGSILLEDRRLDGLPAHAVAARGVSQVAAGRRIFPQLSVAENLDLGAFICRRQRQTRAKQEELVFGLFPVLPQKLRQQAGALSGGEQQMLAIGQALMSAPKVLLCDEPSSGLAPVLVDSIMASLVTIAQQGTTILLVEQFVKRALGIASRVYVMDQGAIALEGAAKELAQTDKISRVYLGGRDADVGST